MTTALYEYDYSMIFGKFDVLVIDPPWQVADCPYNTQSLSQISKLQMPAAEKAHVFIWTTQKYLPDAIRMLSEVWELDYRCTFVWHKPSGRQPSFLPQYNCEFCLYATKGKPRFVDTTAFQTCFSAPVMEHSGKPEEFYDTLRRVTAGRRIDMFNRREIEGFEGWGLEEGFHPTKSTKEVDGVIYNERAKYGIIKQKQLARKGGK